VFSFNLAVVAVAHRWLGDYPPPLPKAKSDRRELLEALIIWVVMLLSVTYLMLARYVFFTNYYFISVGGRLLPLLHLFIMIEAPFIVEVVLNGRRGSDLGFSTPISRGPAFALVLHGALIGVTSFLSDPPRPYPLDYLLLGAFTPVFTEGWVYRSAVQQKLERALGQERAWLLGGLLYGLIHVPTDFFGTLWFISGGDLGTALARLLVQCSLGWVWGILFIKSRSIYPVFVSHYLTNYLPGILAYSLAQ
jgi:membrane protease YdiL (CAAX protease family)